MIRCFGGTAFVGQIIVKNCRDNTRLVMNYEKEYVQSNQNRQSGTV